MRRSVPRFDLPQHPERAGRFLAGLVLVLFFLAAHFPTFAQAPENGAGDAAESLDNSEDGPLRGKLHTHCRDQGWDAEECRKWLATRKAAEDAGDPIDRLRTTCRRDGLTQQECARRAEMLKNRRGEYWSVAKARCRNAGLSEAECRRRWNAAHNDGEEMRAERRAKKLKSHCRKQGWDAARCRAWMAGTPRLPEERMGPDDHADFMAHCRTAGISPEECRRRADAHREARGAAREDDDDLRLRGREGMDSSQTYRGDDRSLSRDPVRGRVETPGGRRGAPSPRPTPSRPQQGR